LEDDLLRIFGSDRISSIMERLGMEEGEPIEHNLISRAIENAQKKVEGHNFDIRKHLLEYDDVMNKHREIIYALRKDVLTGEGTQDIIHGMIEEKLDSAISTYTDPKTSPEDWDIPGLRDYITRLFGFLPKISPEDLGEETFDALKPEDLSDILQTQILEAFKKREMDFGEKDLESIERIIMLQIIDHQWVSHLQDMDHVKEGIGLRGYGQLDPLREYQKEGFALFEGLMERIREEVLMTLSRLALLRNQPEGIPKEKKRPMQLSHGDAGDRPSPLRREGKKIGRNDPCPCGSGKKYKKCCGMNK
jgi:preprotein translocase subunit SecA